jgi:hypothetical protein
MMRTRAIGAIAVVLVTAASGTVAAHGTAIDAATPVDSASVESATFAPTSPAVAAFELPAMATVVQPASRPVPARHRPHLREHPVRHRHHQPVLQPCPVKTPSPHFATPEAAMRYLARAWNHRDLDALCHVTDPEERRMLLAMHSEAVHLQLRRCWDEGVGAVGCSFAHDYPRRLHRHGGGHAYLEARVARTPGWYATGVVGCG